MSRKQMKMKRSNSSSSRRPLTIFLTGAPCTGKTTQLNKLVDYLKSVDHFNEIVVCKNKILEMQSTITTKQRSNNRLKEELRDIIRKQNRMGCIQSVVKIYKRLSHRDVLIFSRGPTSVEQAHYLMECYGVKPDLFLLLDHNGDVESLLQRASSRRVDPVTNISYSSSDVIHDQTIRDRLVSRSSDFNVNIEKFQERMKKYNTRTQPVIHYYHQTNLSSNIRTINANRNMSEVWDNIQCIVTMLLIQYTNASAGMEISAQTASTPLMKHSQQPLERALACGIMGPVRDLALLNRTTPNVLARNSELV